jgi:hypothetical protein
MTTTPTPGRPLASTTTVPIPSPTTTDTATVPPAPSAATEYVWVARPAGAARAGRDRQHQIPRRTRKITAAFTDAEYAALAAAAHRIGLTPTGFCAQAALSATAPSATPPVDAAQPGLPGRSDLRLEGLSAIQAELAQLRTAVTRVGTNLNQAVTALNVRGELPTWLRHVVEQCGRALYAVDAAASRVHHRLP